MAGESKKTTDHDKIRQWTEERGGIPATVRDTEGSEGEPGVLRIDFPGRGAEEETLDRLDWDTFFQKFEEKNLAFLYQDEMREGQESRFYKFVNR